MSDKKFTPQRLMIILFSIAVLFLGTASLFAPKKKFSENENRFLKEFPSLINLEKWAMAQDFSEKWRAIHWNEIYGDEHKFMRDIETYYNDHFWKRDSWISIKTYAEMVSGKREANNVYIGKDGYLIEKFASYNKERAEKNISRLLALSESMTYNKIPFDVMLVPSAIEIMSEKLPAFAPRASQQEIVDLVKKTGLNVVDITNTLLKHADEYIYYRTDHHWTSLGAYYAYAEWCKVRGVEPAPISEWKSEILSDNFRGTTWSKVNLPTSPFDEITAYYKNEQYKVSYNDGSYTTNSIYERKFLMGKDQYAVFFNSNQGLTVVEGGGKSGKLLVIKDSYANAFCQFVLEDYAEVHIIDPRFFKDNIVEYALENGITNVIFLYGIVGFSGNAVIPTE